MLCINLQFRVLTLTFLDLSLSKWETALVENPLVHKLYKYGFDKLEEFGEYLHLFQDIYVMGQKAAVTLV